MRRPRTVLVSTVVIVAVVLTACGSDDGDSSSSTSTTRATSGAAAGGRPILVAGENATLGRIVVDDQGSTVYTLTDANGAAVACEGSCLAAWPPVLILPGTSATGGAGVKDVGSVEGPEGEQATIDGLPLYTFAGDSAEGDATGEGISSFGGTWHVMKVSGGATGTTTTTGSGTTTTYDDGY